jgi:hypothetical protein
LGGVKKADDTIESTTIVLSPPIERYASGALSLGKCKIVGSHCSGKEYLAIGALLEGRKSGQDREKWWQIGNRESSVKTALEGVVESV